jgi:hypothetical protein
MMSSLRESTQLIFVDDIVPTGLGHYWVVFSTEMPSLRDYGCALSLRAWFTKDGFN